MGARLSPSIPFLIFLSLQHNSDFFSAVSGKTEIQLVLKGCAGGPEGLFPSSVQRLL